eukprot:13813552-Alexandrium_andersonii.AAC.1
MGATYRTEGAPPEPAAIGSAGFQFYCAAQCGTLLHAAVKPTPTLAGWPKWWCARCACRHRTSKAICAQC